MKIGSAREVRKTDGTAIEKYGIPEHILMENAGEAALSVVKERWGIPGCRVLLLCGTGNNGGDGFALARMLLSRGGRPRVIFGGPEEKLPDAARINYEILKKLPLSIRPQAEKEDFLWGDLVIDALAGTGLSRPLEGPYKALVEECNKSGLPVLALDIPSGVHADTGQVTGTAVQAEATVSFGVLKRGNLLYPGHSFGGRLYLSPLSFPPELTEDPAITLQVNQPPPLPRRDPAGHKGSFGRVMALAGAASYYGAPAFCAAAALKTGAGYVYLACPAPLVPSLAVLCPEAVFLPQEPGSHGALGLHSLEALLPKASTAGAVAAGPGLSSSPEAQALLQEFIPRIPGAAVIDGDGLGALAGKPEITQGREGNTVLTPHTGEMARLSGLSPEEIRARPLETARETARRYGAVVVLKGAHSIVADPEGEAWVNLTGNDGMGTAGSGDVLTGVIAALLAAGLSPAEAARLGVFLHGSAGDRAAAALSREGLTAGDILRSLPGAIKEFQQNPQNALSDKITLV